MQTYSQTASLLVLVTAQNMLMDTNVCPDQHSWCKQMKVFVFWPVKCQDTFSTSIQGQLSLKFIGRLNPLVPRSHLLLQQLFEGLLGLFFCVPFVSFLLKFWPFFLWDFHTEFKTKWKYMIHLVENTTQQAFITCIKYPHPWVYLVERVVWRKTQCHCDPVCV